MSDIETVIAASKQIEKLLELRFGARGRGLHDKLTSVQDQLPERIVRRARFIASVRNAVVHGDTPMIRDRRGFDEAVEEVSAFLRERWLAGAATAEPQPERVSGPVPRVRPQRRERGPLPWLLLALGVALIIFAVSGFQP